MSILNKIILGLIRRYSNVLNKMAYHILPRDMINVNLDLTNPKQKRVLISYLFLAGVDISRVNHAAYLHFNQIIHYFINRGYCVDTCYCQDETAFERLKHNHYDVIFGFGKAYKAFCGQMDIPERILFIMENDPDVVKVKYQERLAYFKQRHSGISVKRDHVRNEFFDRNQLEVCKHILLMNSSFNAASLRLYGKRIWRIDANAIFNESYQFRDEEVKQWIPESKLRFLWFGSDGFIHKGCDLILDAFRQLPDYKIDFYGLSKSEKPLFEKLRPTNAKNCGRVDVQSDDFIEKVVSRHCFLLFPSCSEGMSTAVCTCMAHGIIPIVTKESGFEPHPSIIELHGWSVDDLKETIERAVSMDEGEILSMRRSAYEYARKQFCLKHFDEEFSEIMDEIV